jgi:hypothetical protein
MDGLNKRVVYRYMESHKHQKEAGSEKADIEEIMKVVMTNQELEAVIFKIWKLGVGERNHDAYCRLMRKNEFINFWFWVKMWQFLLDDDFLHLWSEDQEDQILNKAISYGSNGTKLSSAFNNAQLWAKKALGYTEFKNYWLFIFEPKIEHVTLNKINSYLRAIYKLISTDSIHQTYKPFADLLTAYQIDRITRIEHSELQLNTKKLEAFSNKLGKLTRTKEKRSEKKRHGDLREKKGRIRLLKLEYNVESPVKNRNVLIHLKSTERIKRKMSQNKSKNIRYINLQNNDTLVNSIRMKSMNRLRADNSLLLMYTEVTTTMLIYRQS